MTTRRTAAKPSAPPAYPAVGPSVRPGEETDANPTAEMRAALARLPDTKQDLVRERAAIIHADGGFTWASADRRALELEGVSRPMLPGVE